MLATAAKRSVSKFVPESESVLILSFNRCALRGVIQPVG
jgi:hypothetical protein